MKKYLSLFIALFFLVMGGACMTSSLYQQKYGQKTTNEEISSFLITEDGRQLVVVGIAHHYIFEPNATLKFILTWPEKKHVIATFSNFAIDHLQHISGKYVLKVESNNDLSAEAKTQLLANGFTYDNSKTTLSYQGVLTGKCYLSNNLTIPNALQFNQKYKIAVQETYASPSSTVERVLLTPLMLAADGLLTIAGIPLMLLIIPLSMR
jgi:hypothetical protein